MMGPPGGVAAGKGFQVVQSLAWSINSSGGTLTGGEAVRSALLDG